MVVYPNSKYIPLILTTPLVKNNILISSFPYRSRERTKAEMFKDSTLVPAEGEFMRLHSPRFTTDYHFNKYIVFDDNGVVRALVCKKNDSRFEINSFIPDKSEWTVVICESDRDLNLLIRYAKNIVGVNKKQILLVESMNRMFSGAINVTMEMYAEESQKKIASEFLSHVNNIAV